MPGQWPEWVWEKRVAAVSNMAASGIAGTILTLVETDGTAATPHATSLRGNGAALRDVADAVHALCIIHGTFPGIVDQAVRGATSAPVGAWLQHAAERFAHERAVLARLTAAVGPLPSTPGQAASDAAVLTQRQALAMLARSDRAGCAAGTAFAFVLDWAAVRAVLDACTHRLGLPSSEADDLTSDARAALLAVSASPAVERAMVFGAQQTLAQHRGLWQLLEARASARGKM